MNAKQGDWVQISRVVLPAGERAPQVPEDTQKVPLEMWVKGFLVEAGAGIGEVVSVRTVTGRLVRGTLTAVLPAYSHNFGEPQPELLHISQELRLLLKGGGQGG